jgi:hypothetical protein
MAINFDVPAVCFTFIPFYRNSFCPCKFIQLVIFSIFLCSFDPPNLGTMQQVSCPNQSAAHPMPRPNGQSRSNRFDRCRDQQNSLQSPEFLFKFIEGHLPILA